MLINSCTHCQCNEMQRTYITMEIGERVKHVESMKVHRASSTDIKTADNNVLRNKAA